MSSPTGAEQFAPDFLDPVLAGLLTAQAVWMATGDPAALRRELVTLLLVLG